MKLLWQKEKGILELDSINILNAKVDALMKIVSKVQINSVEKASSTYKLYGGPHLYDEYHMSFRVDINYLQ